MKFVFNFLRYMGWGLFWFTMVVVITIILEDIKLEWTIGNYLFILMMFCGFVSAIMLSIDIKEA